MNARWWVIMLSLLSGCAAQWHRTTSAEDGTNRYVLQFQRNNTAPTEGVLFVQPQDLRAGDILFSADRGFNSQVLRLFGNSSVSHAFLYLGDGKIAEAVGSGVQIAPLQSSIAHSPLLAVYRHPDLNEAQVEKIRQFAEQESGSRYNYVGIVKQTPYTITRKVCELPVIPRHMRHLCLNTMALVQVTPFSGDRYFCSQFVVEAFNRAGVPLTKLSPEWISPADLLHMRENDVASVTPIIKLQYVGHLRCSASLWQGRCTVASGNGALASGTHSQPGNN